MELGTIKKSPSMFVANMMEAINVAQLYHWKTTSLAHAALGEYYSSLSGIMDGIVETYQGKNGILKVELPNDKLPNVAISYFEAYAKYIETSRDVFKDSYIQNQIDTALEATYKLLFKLKIDTNKV
jgi:hypothetical protein